MIRIADINDIPGINVLHTQLHIQHIGYSPDMFAPIEQPLFDTLMTRYIESDTKDIIVSENEGTIDGYAAVSVCDTKKAAGDRLTYIYLEVAELCVAENARRSGIGTALLDAAKAYAKEHGAKFMELGVNAKNPDALEFYKANGMYVQHMRMQYKIQ